MLARLIEGGNPELKAIVLKIRHHNTVAHNASLRWQQRKAWLKEYLKVNAFNYQSEGAKRRKVQEDWDLEDAMNEWNWHRREAGRLSQIVLVELALRGQSQIMAIDPLSRILAEAERDAAVDGG